MRLGKGLSYSLQGCDSGWLVWLWRVNLSRGLILTATTKELLLELFNFTSWFLGGESYRREKFNLVT